MRFWKIVVVVAAAHLELAWSALAFTLALIGSNKNCKVMYVGTVLLVSSGNPVGNEIEFWSTRDRKLDGHDCRHGAFASKSRELPEYVIYATTVPPS